MTSAHQLLPLWPSLRPGSSRQHRCSRLQDALLSPSSVLQASPSASAPCTSTRAYSFHTSGCPSCPQSPATGGRTACGLSSRTLTQPLCPPHVEPDCLPTASVVLVVCCWWPNITYLVGQPGPCFAPCWMLAQPKNHPPCSCVHDCACTITHPLNPPCTRTERCKHKTNREGLVLSLHRPLSGTRTHPCKTVLSTCQLFAPSALDFVCT